MKIGLIGCGHMGSAIAEGLLAQGVKKLLIGTPHKPHVRGPVQWTVDNVEVVRAIQVVIIGVRPFTVAEVLTSLKPHFKKNHIIVSIAAGIPIKKLNLWSGGEAKIVRVMPNLASQVGEGMSLWKSVGLSPKEKSFIKKLLCAFGKEIEVKNEELINYGSQINGCGPAYVAAFLETMEGFLRRAGFSHNDARMMALQSVSGPLKFIEKTNADFGKLKQAVQTKGGVTEAGFKVLTRKKWQKILEQAFEAGYKRTLELMKT